MNIFDELDWLRVLRVRQAMLACDGNKTNAAKLLEVPRSTLQKWLSNDERPEVQERYKEVRPLLHDPSHGPFPQRLGDGLAAELTRRVREGL